MEASHVDGRPPAESGAQVLTAGAAATVENDTSATGMEIDEEPANNEDEDGVAFVQNPSVDVRADLEKVLDELDFQGSIAFSHTYDDAPNPTLRLDNLGLVGLPLSTREAQVIIEHCAQAPFGKGERTVVDKEVRDTWEMDAPQVHFDNPAWKAFLKRIVKDACQALGVNVVASKPRCELYKLLLYQEGSHFLPHVDTEKANGMFASLIIVLPTPFTGGDAHLSHGSQSKILNSSDPSLTKTTVLAWYTDVMHEIKPITSGYRLALAYNLVHTTTSLRPSLSDNTAAISKLRHILLSWKQSEELGSPGPDKIMYKLDHDYSTANLSASALKGSDAHALAILDEAAKAVGMCMGFAHLEHHISGAADDDGDRYYGRKHCYYDDDDDEDENDVGFLEVYERTTTIENLVDLDGNDLAAKVAFDKKDETIPQGFVQDLEDGEHDEQEYEGYMGNGAGSLDRFYRRTVLLIWPRWGSLGSDGDRRAAYALDRLEETNTTEPTVDELSFFFDVLHSRQTDTFDLLCTVARQWNRTDLWQSVVVKLGDDNSMDEIFSAVKSFGFNAVEASLEQFVRTRRRNSQRFEFLSKLRTWAQVQEQVALQQNVAEFVNEQVPWLLQNICPLAEDELQLLTDQALAYGGAHFLQTTILPQLRASTSHRVMEAYATFLHDIRGRLAVNDEDRATLARVVGELLSMVLERTNFFPKPAAQPTHGYDSYRARTSVIQKPASVPDAAFNFVKKCLDFGEAAVAARAIERLVDMTGQTPDIASTRALSVLLPLTPLLDAELKTRVPPPVLPLDQLGATAIRLTLESQHAKQGQLSKDDINTLLTAVAVSNNSALLSDLILPSLKSTQWNESGWKAMIEQLHSRRTDPAFAEGPLLSLNEAIVDLTTTYASKAQLSAHAQPSQIASVLDCCLKIGGPLCLKTALDRVLDPRMLTAPYISQTLLPLIAFLCSSASTVNIPLSTDPIAPALRMIMRLWTQKVLGPKPDDARSESAISALSRWNCSCAECSQVLKFLQASPERQLSLQRIGAPKRKHVEGYLSSYARSAATFTMIRTTPQGLTVTKTDLIIGPIIWKSNQKIGLRALKSMGNETELRAIFGDQYPVVVGALTGMKVPAGPPPPSAAEPGPRMLPGGSNVARPAPAAPVTPAKRKSEAVIDLCTP